MIYNWLFVAALFLIPCCGVGQEISGTIVDIRKEPVINATIQVFQNSVIKGGTVSDFDGNYSIKPLDSGNYDVFVFFPGYVARHVMAVIVGKQEKTKVNFTLDLLTSGKRDTMVTTYKTPLMKNAIVTTNPGEVKSKHVVCQTADLVGPPGVYKRNRMLDETRNGPHAETRPVYVIDSIIVVPEEGISNNGKSAKHKRWFRWLRKR